MLPAALTRSEMKGMLREVRAPISAMQDKHARSVLDGIAAIYTISA